ncbi:MAG: M56 family metallopeptidase [Planctomycetota bacterium]
MTVQWFIAWVSEISARAAPYLFDAAAKASVLLMTAILAARLLRRQPAVIRHRIWKLAALSLLGLPLVSIVVPKWHLPSLVPSVLQSAEAEDPDMNQTVYPDPLSFLPQHRMRMTMDLQHGAAATLKSPSSSISMNTSRAQASGAGTSYRSAELPGKTSWQTWMVLLWICGFVCALIPLASGIVIISRIRSAATPIKDERLLGILEATCKQLDLKRGVFLAKTKKSVVPLTCGLFRPCILLPWDAGTWTLEKNRIILHHELVHIRRRDCLVQALARLASALHWFNPLAWRAMKGLILEGEAACDSQVIRNGSKPLDYASCLLEMARSIRPNRPMNLATLTMLQRSNLELRLRLILDATQRRREPGGLAQIAVVLCAALLLSPLAVLQCTGEVTDEKTDPSTSEARSSHRDTQGRFGEEAETSYLVLAAVSETDPYFAAAELLADYRNAEIIRFDTHDLPSLLEKLKKRAPRFVAAVVKPEGIDTHFVRQFCMMSARVDSDPFCDFAWGLITGATASDATCFVENIIRADREGVPKRFFESCVVESHSQAIYDCSPAWLQDSGFVSDRIEFGLEDAHNELAAFTETHLVDFEHRGIIQITGCGDPERIWLFDEHKVDPKIKRRDSDPVMVGRNPGDELLWIDAQRIRRLDLYPAVLSCGTSDSGTVRKAFVRNNLVSEPGCDTGTAVYDIPPGKSLCLAFLSAGVTAAFLPVGPTHGWRTCVEVNRTLNSGAPLGEVMKSCYDELVLAGCGPIDLSLLDPDSEAEPSGDVYALMREDAASRILYGDPAFTPFQDTQSRALEVDLAPSGDGSYTLTCTVLIPFAYEDLRVSDFVDQFTPYRMRIPIMVDLPAELAARGVHSVSLTGNTQPDTNPACEVRWAEEDWEGKVRLHVAALAMESPEACPFSCEAGRTLCFRIEPARFENERQRIGLTPARPNLAEELYALWCYEWNDWKLGEILSFIEKHYADNDGSSRERCIRFELDPAIGHLLDRTLTLKLETETLKTGLDRIGAELGIAFMLDEARSTVRFFPAPGLAGLKQ